MACIMPRMTWYFEEICAGTTGKGAQDATYGTALIMEYCRLHGLDFSASSAMARRLKKGRS